MKDTSGTAFPHFGMQFTKGETIPSSTGMSLRDYFAAKAMQGICTSKDEAGTLVNHGYEWIASESYKIADAMLKERNK